MNESIESTLQDGKSPDAPIEDQRIDDLYHVPALLTVPSLLDEV